MSKNREDCGDRSRTNNRAKQTDDHNKRKTYK